MIHHLLLDERFDDPIMEQLMFQGLDGNIKDSGQKGDERIYLTLKAIENQLNIKL